MSIEYIRFRIQKDLHDDFIKAVGDANTILNAYTNCLRYEISRCEEDSDLFVWRIEWTSTQAHLEGFRNDKVFESFHHIMKPFIAQILEMNHYHKLD